MHIDTDVNALTEKIIGCAIEVHSELGPGLLESIYRECLDSELKRAGFKSERDRRVDVLYKGERVSSPLRLDLVIERAIVVELKAVERVLPLYSAQVITYLKLAGYPAGLLLNFNATSLRAGIKRLNHPDLHRLRHAWAAAER